MLDFEWQLNVNPRAMQHPPIFEVNIGRAELEDFGFGPAAVDFLDCFEADRLKAVDRPWQP